MSANHRQVSEQLESCESSGGDAPLADPTATLPQAAILSPPEVSEQLESCESSGGDAPLAGTLPPASIPSPPVVRKCVLSIVIGLLVMSFLEILFHYMELSCTCVQNKFAAHMRRYRRLLKILDSFDDPPPTAAVSTSSCLAAQGDHPQSEATPSIHLKPVPMVSLLLQIMALTLDMRKQLLVTVY